MLRTTLTSPQPIVVHASEELKACRACLITDTKLYNLHEWRLAQPFEVLTGIPITTENIRNLNTSNLILNFSKTDTLTLDYIPASNPESLAAVEVKNDGHVQLSAKLEVIDDDDVQSIAEVELQDDYDVKFVQCNSYGSESYFIKKSDEENKDAINNFLSGHFAMKGIKIEEPKICFNTSSSNEISLTGNHKQVDVKREDVSGTNKSSKIRKITKHEEGKPLKNPINKKPNRLKVVDKKKSEEIEVKRKCARKESGKLGYFKKKEDYAEFSKLYNVEVMIYTIEEQIKLRLEQKENAKYQGARFKCEHCFTGFVLETALSNHMKCHDPSRGSLVCEVCKFRFPSDKIERFRLHCRMHQKRFICKLCNHWSKDSNSAKVHHKWHQGFKYECKDCDKCFATRAVYLGHRRDIHTSQTCNLCQETFAGVRKLSRHKALMHALVLNPHLPYQFLMTLFLWSSSCFLCGENFPVLAELEDHQRDQHKFLQCKDCHQMFPTERKRKKHWLNRHSARALHKEVICEVCAKSFWNETALRYHQRTHRNERPFQCSMCPKRFFTKDVMKGHMNTHTGVRPYKCRLCPATFHSHVQRYRHMFEHTSERPHKCHLCDKTYVVVGHLKMHLRTFHMKLPYPPRKNPRRRANKILNK